MRKIRENVKEKKNGGEIKEIDCGWFGFLCMKFEDNEREIWRVRFDSNWRELFKAEDQVREKD